MQAFKSFDQGLNNIFDVAILVMWQKKKKNGDWEMKCTDDYNNMFNLENHYNDL